MDINPIDSEVPDTVEEFENAFFAANATELGVLAEILPALREAHSEMMVAFHDIVSDLETNHPLGLLLCEAIPEEVYSKDRSYQEIVDATKDALVRTFAATQVCQGVAIAPAHERQENADRAVTVLSEVFENISSRS